MSDTAPSAVEAIRAQLAESEKVAAGLRQAAEDAANALVVSPSRQNQVTRDELAGRAELASLTAELLKRSLAEAQASAREARIAELLAGHTEDVVVPAMEAEKRLHAHLGGLEDVLTELKGLRVKAGGIARALLALEHSKIPSSLGLSVDAGVVRRLNGLAGDYEKPVRDFRTG